MSKQARRGRINRTKAGLGAALFALGVTGLAFTVTAPATATVENGQDGHNLMHEMMDAMHGEGTSERMHDVEGAEEMMETCSSMMDSMSSMGAMMNSGGMMGS